MKTLFGSAPKFRANIFREHFRLPHSKLSSGRTGLSRARIGKCGTITKGPHPWTTAQLKRVPNNQGAALVFFYRKRLQQRIWTCSCRPHESLRADLTVAYGHDSGTHIGQTRIQAESDSARFHPALCITCQ